MLIPDSRLKGALAGTWLWAEGGEREMKMIAFALSWMAALGTMMSYVLLLLLLLPDKDDALYTTHIQYT